MKRFVVFVCAGAGLVWAQGGGQPPMEQHVRIARPPAQGDAGANKTFVMAEMARPGKVVKNAPYSAQIVTEMTQVLSDGNRIHHSTTATVQRDSEGRTRNEVSGGEMVFISDPVAGVNFMLDKRTGTVRKVGGVVGGVPGGVAGGIVSSSGTKMIGRKEKTGEAPKRQVEHLGMQTIEGVQAEGTRTTTIIPAGQVGNEKPIEVVTEQWYSPQLQTTVLTKTKDPRMGETVMRLTNLSLAEPPRSAFEVPAEQGK